MQQGLVHGALSVGELSQRIGAGLGYHCAGSNGLGDDMLKGRKLTPRAAEGWGRRADALEAGTVLMSEKPDEDDWTKKEFRAWRYAMAVSRRLEKLH